MPKANKPMTRPFFLSGKHNSKQEDFCPHTKIIINHKHAQTEKFEEYKVSNLMY